MVKKLPLPIVGLGLGLVALGNLLGSYSEVVRYCLGLLGALILILFTIKIFTQTESFKEDMKNPVMASVFGTYSIAITILSGYAKPYLPTLATVLFYLGILIHLVLIAYFSKTFVMKLEMPKIHASYFIVYAGIASAGLVAKAIGNPLVGKICVIAAFLMYLPMLLIVSNRYIKNKEVPELLLPVKAIYAAPAALIFAGYMSVFDEKSLLIVVVGVILSEMLYLFGLVQGFKYAFKKFFPSFSSFTFPYVISTIALKMATGFFAANNMSIAGVLSILVTIQTVIAVFFVLFVLIKYTQFLTKKN